VGTRERPGDRGRRRAREAIERLGRDHRTARVGAGVSLRAVAAATGTSHQQVLRFERGELEHASIDDIGAWCSAIGMDLVLKAYSRGDPLRDAGQLRLLGRLRDRLHPELSWRTEVPLPIEGDLRAWDAVIRGDGWWVAVEAETALDDLQALERRIALKIRDGGSPPSILLIADTRRNRRALDGSVAFTTFDRRARRVLRALEAGLRPREERALVVL